MISGATISSTAVYLAINLILLGSLLAIGVTLAFKLIPTSLTRLRYLIALAAFLLAVALPSLATFGFIAKQEKAPMIEVESQVTTTDKGSTEAESFFPSSQPTSVSLSNRIIDSIRRMAESALSVGFFWTWFIIAFFLLVREFLGYAGLLRAQRSWQPAPATWRQELRWPDNIPLYMHECEGPSAVGFFRPSVVLPLGLLNDLQIDVIRQIAKHELDHARWRDPLVNALLRIIRAVFWPSLPLWFLERLAYTEREASADQVALASTHLSDMSQRAVDYAASLVSIARWSTTAKDNRFFDLPGAQASDRRVFEKRVGRLLRFPIRPSRTRTLIGIIVLLSSLTGTAFLPVAIALPTGVYKSKDSMWPIRFENQAAASLAITEAKLKVIDDERYEVKTAITLFNNTARRISSFRLRFTNSAQNFERVFSFDRVTIEPQQFFTVQPQWQQGRQPDWSLGNSGAINLIDVRFKDEKNEEPENLPSRIFFRTDGSATLIRETAEGEVEEPILSKSEAESTASAITRSIPPNPLEASALSEGGIAVLVMIDEYGNVISARGVSGNKNPAMGKTAVEAARQWKFTPSTVDGVPIKVVSTLTFFGAVKTTNGFISLW